MSDKLYCVKIEENVVTDVKLYDINETQTCPVGYESYEGEFENGPGIGWIKNEDGSFTDPDPRQPTQEEINNNARGYLNFTDWYVIREVETGKSYSDEIKQLRQEARDKVIEDDQNS